MTNLSYVHGASEKLLLGQTIGACFDETVAANPDVMALIVRHQGVRWTYAELKERVDALAGGLLALGLEPGDRIGVWAPNCASGR
jgi:fatty-acyl-CoA synthase